MPWLELGDQLGAVTEGQALQMRVEQMFPGIPEQLSISEPLRMGQWEVGETELPDPSISPRFPLWDAYKDF